MSREADAARSEDVHHGARGAGIPVDLQPVGAQRVDQYEEQVHVVALCERLDLEKDTYAVSIPLGATINMGGAAITITVLTLAAAHTLGINVDLPTALLLSIVAALSACGASGVAGGSLLLIPLSCSLFGISNDIAMQVVAVGFVISILQDSAETALNSSTDVVFTAAFAAKD